MKRNYQADLIKHLEDEIKFLRGLVNQTNILPKGDAPVKQEFKSGLELTKEVIQKMTIADEKDRLDREKAIADLDNLFVDSVGVIN